MRGTYTRGQHSRQQLVVNQKKLEKTQSLIGKQLIDQGIVGKVVAADYKTGDALVRFKGARIDKSYNPNYVEKLIVQS